MSLTLDREIAAALAPMAGVMASTEPPAVGDVAGRRALWEPIIGAAGARPARPGRRDDQRAPRTADDGARITMRWYAKDGATPGSAVLFFHGGGYIFGHIDLFDGPLSRYVSASGVPMLSVEYRRAPEHPFPTPLEDAYAALLWLHEHAAELGVDPARTRRPLGFEDAALTFDPAAGTFTARILVLDPPLPVEHGRFLVAGGLLTTAVTVGRIP